MKAEDLISMVDGFRFTKEYGFTDDNGTGCPEDLGSDEVLAIADATDRDFLKSVYLAYKLGFLRGSGRLVDCEDLS